MATPINAVDGITLSEFGLIAIGIIIGYMAHWFKGFWGKISAGRAKE